MQTANQTCDRSASKRNSANGRCPWCLPGMPPAPPLWIPKGNLTTGPRRVFFSRSLLIKLPQFPIPPGGNFTYEFSTADQYGFYWYHSHFRAYYDDAIRGGLLIHPSSKRDRPFQTLAKSTAEVASLMKAERNASSVLLNDWTHAVSDMIYHQYFKTGAFPFCVNSLLANGLGRVECLPDSVLRCGTDLCLGDAASSSITTSTSAMASTTSGVNPTINTAKRQAMDMSMTELSPRGCTPPMMFRPGFNSSFLPPETCISTTSPLLTIQADAAQGWMALNLVNAGAVSMLSVSLDSHSMFVYMADGLYVDMQEIQVGRARICSLCKLLTNLTQVLEMGIGQRYSIMIKLDQKPGNYALRYATYPTGDMQQVLEGHSIVSYEVSKPPIFKSPWRVLEGG